MAMPIGYLIKDDVKNESVAREPRIVTSIPQIAQKIALYEEHKVSDYLNQTYQDLDTVKEAVEESQEITPSTHRMVCAMFESIQNNIGFKDQTVYPSLESFGQLKSEAGVKVVVLESIMNTIRKVWDYIKKLFKELWEAVRGFFKRMYSQEARVGYRIKQLKKRFEELKFSVPKEEDTEGYVFTDAFSLDGVLKRGDVQVIINNHVMTIKDAKKGLSEVLDTLSYNQKVQEKLGEKVKEMHKSVIDGHPEGASGKILDMESSLSIDHNGNAAVTGTIEALASMFGFKEYIPENDVKRDLGIDDKCELTRSYQLMGNRSIVVIVEKDEEGGAITKRIEVRDMPFNASYSEIDHDVRVKFLDLNEISPIFSIVEDLFKTTFEHDHLRTLDRIERSVERIIKLHDTNLKILDDVIEGTKKYYEEPGKRDDDNIVVDFTKLKERFKESRDMLNDTYKMLTSYYRRLFQPSVAACMVALNYIEISIKNYED